MVLGRANLEELLSVFHRKWEIIPQCHIQRLISLEMEGLSSSCYSSSFFLFVFDFFAIYIIIYLILVQYMHLACTLMKDFCPKHPVCLKTVSTMLKTVTCVMAMQFFSQYLLVSGKWV